MTEKISCPTLATLVMSRAFFTFPLVILLTISCLCFIIYKIILFLIFVKIFSVIITGIAIEKGRPR